METGAANCLMHVIYAPDPFIPFLSSGIADGIAHVHSY
jgi:hypothetical protein